MQIRLGPSGPPIIGANPGDILEWDGIEWQVVPGGGGGALVGDADGPAANNRVTSLSQVGLALEEIPITSLVPDAAALRPLVVEDGVGIRSAAVAELAGLTEFDFIITSRADLAAVAPPVGDVFTLPAGSYAFKDTVTLNANERILCNAVAGYFLQCMAPGGKTIEGDFAGPLLTVATVTTMVGVDLDNDNADPAARTVVSTASTLRTISCNFSTSNGAGGCEMNGTRWFDFGSRIISGNGTCFEQSLGQLKLIGTQLQSGGGNAFQMNDAASEAFLTNVDLSSGATVLQHLAPNGDLFLTDCDLACGVDGVAVAIINNASSLSWKGGRVSNTDGNAGDGINFAGNVAGGVELIGIQFESLDDAIIRTAGVQNRVAIIGCDSAADVNTGVDWDAANIPTSGLLEIGNQFNTLAPFQNHVATSPRVNRKANSLQAALSSETPIVP